MTGVLTNRGRYLLASGGIVPGTTDLRMALLSAFPGTGIPQLNTVADLASAGYTELSATGYSRQALTSVTATEDDSGDRAYVDSADVSFGALTGAASVMGYAVYVEGATDSARNLVCLGSLTTSPLNGSTVTVSTPSGLYQVISAGAPQSVDASPVPVTASLPALDVSVGSSDWPSPSNTGYSGSLTTYTGDYTITTNGTTIENKIIEWQLTIDADNVTIRNCLILGSTDGDTGFCVVTYGGTNILVEDCELTRTGTTPGRRQVACYGGDSGTSITFRRCYMHGMKSGIGFYQAWNVTLDNCYIGDNYNPGSGERDHTSCLGTWGASHGITADHCTLRTEASTFASSVISIYPQVADGGPNYDWTINECLLSAGGPTEAAAFAIYPGYTASEGESPNVRMTFTDNAFNTDQNEYCGASAAFGNWTTPTHGSPPSDCVLSGNYWWDPDNTYGKHLDPVTAND